MAGGLGQVGGPPGASAAQRPVHGPGDQPEHAGADKGGGRATDADPYGQRILQRARVDGLAGERRAVLAGPFDVCVRADGEEQIKFFSEKLVVVFEPQAKERIGLNE